MPPRVSSNPSEASDPPVGMECRRRRGIPWNAAVRKFIDEARVFVHAGKGGDGAIAFLREKYRAFGGPAGGDGGKGGDVVLEVDEGMSTLLDFKYKPRLAARNGESGRGQEQNRHT